MRPPALVLLALLAWSSVASAQLHVGADATAAWPYVWRGLTRANGRVEEVEGFLTLEFHAALFSAGRWQVYEGGATARPPVTTLTSGLPAPSRGSRT